MSERDHEKINALRWLAIVAMAAMFVSDYMLDVWIKPPPNAVYWVIGGVVLGVDVREGRDLFLRILRAMVPGDKK